MNDWFRRLALKVSTLAGKPQVFFTALIIILTWGLTGPVFNYSDTWQLVINTATTIVTFLMVFLIQNTQNRDSKAIQLKLDELVKTQRGARNTFINLEDLPDEELEKLHKESQEKQAHYASLLQKRNEKKATKG